MNMITPVSTSDINHDIAEAVRSTALLASLSVSVWSAERSDRKLMERLKEDTGAIGNTGRVLKNLLCGVDGPLKNVQAAYKQARYLHYDLTLPWISSPKDVAPGPRLLPTSLFMTYIEKMTAQRNHASAQLDAFLVDYDTMVRQAMANLGGMASKDDYPSVDEVKGLFRLTFDFEPIPAGAAFCGLPPKVTAQLTTILEAKQRAAAANAQAAMWEQVRERVGHLVDRLADPDTRFKSSSIRDVEELLKLLPGWNVASDERVGEIVDNVRMMLDGVNAEALRKDKDVRADVASQAKAIVEKLNSWGV